jgi:hypothetical protein
MRLTATDGRRRRAAAAFAFAATLLAAQRSADEATAPAAARVAVCFAPGTPASYMDEVSARAAASEPKAYTIGRWSRTATDGFGLSQGDPTTLTWSIVPDGTTIPPRLGDPASISDLRAFLNSVYGSESTWLPLFESVFARWSELTGVRYVHEPADDGVSLSGGVGVLGVRADIRIGGRTIDGDFGVLGYNSFPDDGDMVLDTSDDWFRNTGLDSRRLRNVVSHEHGHGLGLDHACPLDQTKLMEPSASLSFVGPQHDDVLGAQYLYGDPLEHNDALVSATDLGEPENATKVVVTGVGVDGTGDSDFYAFTVPEGVNADVTLRPVGKSYSIAPEISGGQCAMTSTTDSRKIADLRLALLDTDGSVLAAADAAREGGTESIVDVPLPSGAGRYFVRVRNAGEGQNQMYTLELVAEKRGEKPVSVPDVDETWEVLPVATAVFANDSGLADAPLRLRISDPPLVGKAVVDGDRIVYVPPRGFTGDVAYSYEVRDIHDEVASAEVAVTVRASARAGDARVDSDGDGYPDEFEAARGTSAVDPASIPGENIAAGAAALFVNALRLVLRSRTPSTDDLAFVGRLPVADGFEPEGAVVVVAVAGVTREFVLDAAGRSLTPASPVGRSGPAFRLRLKRRRGDVVGGEVRFDLRLVRGDFAAQWADEGLGTSRRQVREPRAATAIVMFDGRTRIATLPLVWSAAKGASGVARSVR